MNPPSLAIPGIDVALMVTAAVGISFVVLGLAHDLLRKRRQRLVERITNLMTAVLFHGEADAAEAAEQLASLPTTPVLDMVQRLATDLEGDADTRLRKLVATAGLHRRIRRQLRSRAWRKRTQSAGLASLLPSADPLRRAVLNDPHPSVRSRGAECLDAADAAQVADQLIEMLNDDTDAVRFAAQQALLRGGSEVVVPLGRYLTSGTGPGTAWALEVAANIPDPRLVRGMRRHFDSPHAGHRAIATRAVAPWLQDPYELRDRLNDEDPVVRATAAEAVGIIRAEQLAADIGRMLSDQSWLVRQQAGHALAAMGPTGTMTLRIHLDDEDPYAQDMARQVLDTLTVWQQYRVGAAA